jgi:hypothetical protein
MTSKETIDPRPVAKPKVWTVPVPAARWPIRLAIHEVGDGSKWSSSPSARTDWSRVDRQQTIIIETFARGCEPKTAPYQLRQESGATPHDAVTIDSRPQGPAHRDIGRQILL